jgi:hypothetical protein
MVGQIFEMPVGPGIEQHKTERFDKSRFRNFRFFCLMGNRKGPNRERDLSDRFSFEIKRAA